MTPRQYFIKEADRLYPMPEGVHWKSEQGREIEAQRAAHVNACMGMYSKIGEAWEAGRQYQHYDYMMECWPEDWEGPEPPDKSEYINSLFK